PLPDDTPRRASIPMSPPVSREVPTLSGEPPRRPGRIELSPAEREAAAISGIDEVTYAQNKLRLIELKKRGHYQERGGWGAGCTSPLVRSPRSRCSSGTRRGLASIRGCRTAA